MQQFKIMNIRNKAAAILFGLLSISGYSQSSDNKGVNGQPKLVVELIIGGVRYDQLIKYSDNLSDDGFKKLAMGGASFSNAHCGYMYTAPECGSATIASGSTPAGHGVMGSSWVNYTTNSVVLPFYNKTYKGVGCNEDEGQYAPDQLIFSTLADEMKVMNSSSKVVSIAHDYSDAIIHGGLNPDGCYWYDSRYGTFVTSSYYSQYLPSWVTRFNSSKLNESYNSTIWGVEYDISRYRYKNATAVLVEKNKTLSFDLLFKPKNTDYSRMPYIPMGNSFLKDFAIEAIKRDSLGADHNPDLLVVNFAANRNVSRIYGSESAEAEDSYYKLDKDIAEIIRYLEENVGDGNFVVVLTSSHGISNNVSSGSAKSGKFNAMQFKVLVGGFLNAQLGTGNWITDYKNRQIYLNRRLVYERGLSLEEVQTKIVSFALQFDGVAHAVAATSMQSTYFGSGVMEKMQQSYFPRHGGDVMINLLPGWIEIENDSDTQTTSLYGSSYIYDSHVPLIFYGADIAPKVVHTSVGLRDIAPTISEMLRVTPPNSSDGRSINEIVEK